MPKNEEAIQKLDIHNKQIGDFLCGLDLFSRINKKTKKCSCLVAFAFTVIAQKFRIKAESCGESFINREKSVKDEDNHNRSVFRCCCEFKSLDIQK